MTMKKLLHFTFLACALLLVSCRDICRENAEPEVKIEFFNSDADKIPNFTKIYAEGAKTSPILINNPISSNDVFSLPINISATKTTYIFEKANEQKRLTIQYEVKPFYQNKRCGYRFELANLEVVKEESDFGDEVYAQIEIKRANPMLTNHVIAINYVINFRFL